MNEQNEYGVNMSRIFHVGIFIIMLSSASLAFAAGSGGGNTYDLGIESMRSHGYSVGIFVFLMISIAVFLFIIGAFWKNGDGVKIKTGEKVLLGMIVLGVLVAIAFAAAQLLDGFLF